MMPANTGHENEYPISQAGVLQGFFVIRSATSME